MAATMGVALTATVAATTVVVVGATVATSQFFDSGQDESLSAYAPAETRHQWVIATEEGWGNVRVCRYDSEAAARVAFDKIWCARILYNPQDKEVAQAGLRSAHTTIRQAMREGYFKRPPLVRRAVEKVAKAAAMGAAAFVGL